MARRGHGEGSIYQRKDGRWVASITLENRKRKTLYGKTRREVQEKLKAALHEQQQGMLAIGPQQTLKSYLDQWLEEVHKPTIRIGTYVRYRVILDKHLIPGLGHIQVQKLTPQQVQSFYTKKLEEGYASSTIVLYHAVLHEALDNAVRWNLISRNVCDLVSSPRIDQHEMQPLTQEQVKRLLEAVQKHTLEGLLTLAVTTGMRQGELLGLRWQDIDFEARRLQVRRSVSRPGKYGVTESEPKTAKGRRSIQLPQFVVDALQEHYKRQQEVRVKAGDKWVENGFVFCTRYGRYIGPSDLRKVFNRLLTSAGLPIIRFHDLRHSAATILLGMGVHPKVVQELLGHSNISITMNIYSHVLPSMQQEAMNKLDDLFGQ